MPFRPLPRISVYNWHMENRDLERVLFAATEAAGGDEARARRWLGEALEPFNNKTPLTLIEEGRADDMLRLIESIKGGPAG
jgi:hypothetical protein